MSADLDRRSVADRDVADRGDPWRDAGRGGRVAPIRLALVNDYESDLVAALERVAAGERLGLEHVTRRPTVDGTDPLSMREREVLAMLALGSSNAQIATELFLSVDTIKTYVRRVFQELGVHNRTQAAIRAQQYELAAPPSRLERLRSGAGEPGAT